MRSDNLYELPKDLPAPEDDGAANHLTGAEVPQVALMSTQGRRVSLADASRRGRVVVFGYPRTGVPDKDPPPGWDAVPGARGCTPQTCGFRDQHEAYRSLGVEVYGLSVQDTDYQREMAGRLKLPFEVLSDVELELTRAMRLPTFVIHGNTLMKRIALVLHRGRVEKVFYPVFPPDRNSAEVLAWLREHPAAAQST